ncbi:hypothetical protein Acr_11g0015500 [Actinidia rufa]|uniref:Uncharacterized protein n=1 Tax=Actinidia rufa TaxID=165716 RepID=A0A7J0FEW5_9ERIC|nr:hypothetical protein Acr_11g0015500 [Actinidia rufa]
MCGGAIIADFFAPASSRPRPRPRPCNDVKDYFDDEDGDGRDFAFSASKSGLSHDQESNSFDCSDFEWGEYNGKMPEISSLPSAAIKDDEAQFVQDANPTKKLKPNPVDVVPDEENSGKKLSEELSEFESQMKFFQIPYLEGNWDASVDTFLGGDATQDGGNSMDFWIFNDLVTGVY